MTGLLHLYAFIPLVLVIILMAWIAIVLHAGEDPPAHNRDTATPRDPADNPDAPGPKASG
jgi:hypothetical protein